jgi:hypothetical protein
MLNLILISAALTNSYALFNCISYSLISSPSPPYNSTSYTYLYPFSIPPIKLNGRLIAYFNSYSSPSSSSSDSL